MARQHDEAICFLLDNSPGNYLEESIQHSEHSESLKSRMMKVLFAFRKFVNIPTKRGSDWESEVLLTDNLGSTGNKVARVTDIHSGISLHLIPLGNACSPAVWNMLMSRLLSAVAGTTMQSYEVHHSQWALCWHQDDTALTQSTLKWQRPALCPSWSHAWDY